MSNNTEFKWTENIVAEFIQTKLYISESASFDLIEQFIKESKQPKPEWEIIQVASPECGLYYLEGHKMRHNERIYSVKRLSDGEIFSLGDKVVYGSNSSRFDIIKNIKLGDNQFGPDSPLAPYFSTENSTFGCYIHEINHYKEAVFTTEDGIAIYKDYSGKISTVYEDFSFNYDCPMRQILSEREKNYPFTIKYFSTKEAAREFIIDNKPLLSLKEIREVGHAEKNNPYYKKLVALAESKLK